MVTFMLFYFSLAMKTDRAISFDFSSMLNWLWKNSLIFYFRPKKGPLGSTKKVYLTSKRNGGEHPKLNGVRPSN